MAQGEVVYLRYSKLAWVGTGKFGGRKIDCSSKRGKLRHKLMKLGEKF